MRACGGAGDAQQGPGVGPFLLQPGPQEHPPLGFPHLETGTEIGTQGIGEDPGLTLVVAPEDFQVALEEAAEELGGGGAVALLQPGCGLGQGLADQAVGDVGEQGVFVGIVPEEGGVAHAGPRGDGAHRDRLQR